MRSTHTKKPAGPLLPARIARLAAAEIGVKETSPNRGERIQEYKSATWLDPSPPWPWCAAFVCWVVLEAMAEGGSRWTFDRPQTAGAWDFERWSLAQDRSTWTKKPPALDIEPGDILVYRFSHIGIAVSRPNKNGRVRTVEGNTNAQGSREGDGVWAKSRRLDQIRSRIRFRV